MQPIRHNHAEHKRWHTRWFPDWKANTLIFVTISHQCPGKIVKPTKRNDDGLQVQEGRSKVFHQNPTKWHAAAGNTSPGRSVLLQGNLLPAEKKALHFRIMKGHLIAQIALLGKLSFIYWALMGLNSCLPLLDASCFLLCKWLIGTVNIAVDRYINFRGRRCFWSWILCASPHIQKATPELEKMYRCIRVHQCISSEDHQKYQVASAPETTKSRRALLFEEDVSRGQWWLSLLVQEAQGSKWACQTAVLKDRKIPVYIIRS